ncbi:MAG TPA: ATP-binding cassette domain-containing protein [Solirubrobacteraceae bacterium]|nr:ATP-binding cassette domain-containing protein [Solirubrobacteraceae bacterium]
MAEDQPAEDAAGSGAESYEHPASGELEPAEPEIASAGVVFEPPPREGEEEDFRFHTGVVRVSKVPDAIEFVDVHKSFGRNHVLRGLSMGIPEDRISMIIGPSGTGKSVCIKHIVGLLYPDEGDVSCTGSRSRAFPTPTCSSCERSSECCSRTARCSVR